LNQDIYNITIEQNKEDSKVTEVRYELENIRNARRAERDQYEERQKLERERLDAELDSSNVDATLLKDLAMQSAKRAIGSKTINNMQVNMADENDQSSAVLAGLLGKYEMAKPISAKK
jgi:hypothetical protein